MIKRTTMTIYKHYKYYDDLVNNLGVCQQAKYFEYFTPKEKADINYEWINCTINPNWVCTGLGRRIYWRSFQSIFISTLIFWNDLNFNYLKYVKYVQCKMIYKYRVSQKKTPVKEKFFCLDIEKILTPPPSLFM